MVQLGQISNFQSSFGFVDFIFRIPISIPVKILELGFHESTTELSQLLISENE